MEQAGEEDLRNFLLKRRSGDLPGAWVLLVASAKAGNARAMWELGSAYHLGGLGAEKDSVEGAKWYRRAAEAGYPPAMSEYAACLWFGEGVPQNQATARVWAADALLANDDYAMGVCYYYGIGVVLDRERARRCFERAAGSIAEARHFLGQIYEFRCEAETAAFWWRSAAAEGLEHSKKALVVHGYHIDTHLKQAANQIHAEGIECDGPGCGHISASLKACAGCHSARYCSELCQKRDWPAHKPCCLAKKYALLNERGVCSIKVLAVTGLYSSRELNALAACREFLRKAPQKAVAVINKPAALARFHSSNADYVESGSLRCVRSRGGRLFTFGVATCAVLIICGNSKGTPLTLLQHLSGHNFRGQPQAHVCRDLRKLLGDDFCFTSGCIIPGGFLDNELIAPEVDAHDPTMQLLLWEQLEPLTWRDSLELWTEFRATYKIEVTAEGKVRIFADRALEGQRPERRNPSKAE